MVKRETYLSKLRQLKDVQLIKVVTGVRRSGKFLLSSYPSEMLDKYTAQAGRRTINVDMTKSSGAGIGSTSHIKTEVLTLNYDCDNILQQARLF
jgi:hypothetical protein